jgi:hypothetical protein
MYRPPLLVNAHCALQGVGNGRADRSGGSLARPLKHNIRLSLGRRIAKAMPCVEHGSARRH